jgi:calcineurin-like phosphoesterase
MNILYIGDVMGEMGLAAVEKVLPQLKKDRALDMVFAQAENASAGKGLLISDYERLKDMGVDACTGGDHTVDKIEIFPLLEDSKIPIIGPANMQECPGPGYKYVTQS